MDKLSRKILERSGDIMREPTRSCQFPDPRPRDHTDRPGDPLCIARSILSRNGGAQNRKSVFERQLPTFSLGISWRKFNIASSRCTVGFRLSIISHARVRERLDDSRSVGGACAKGRSLCALDFPLPSPKVVEKTSSISQ